MSEHDRENEISQAIVDLEKKLDEETIKAEGGTRIVLLYISHILSILNSEYGMIMRVVHRQNTQDKILEKLTALLERGDEESGVNLAGLYRSARKRQKIQWASFTILLTLALTTLYQLATQPKISQREVIIYHTNYIYRPGP